MIIGVSLLLPTVSFADEDHSEGYFSSSSENGLTGVFETQTARIMNNNHFRLGFNQTKPYRNYFAAVSIFNRLELSGMFTEIMGTRVQPDSDYWKGYGDYKDKFVGVKLKIVNEGKYTPAVAIGLNDPHGTKLYGAQYIVASKQLYPFDLSAGIGIGRLGDKPFNTYSKADIIQNFFNPKEYYSHGNPFFSINFRPSKKYSIVYEYNPIEYNKHTEDPAVSFGLVHSDSHHSVGVRYYVGDNFYVTGSYQRANTFGVGLTMPFEIGAPLIPIYNKKVVFSEEQKNSDDYQKITAALNAAGFGPVSVVIQDDTAFIDCQNNRFFYEKDAIDQLAKLLYDINPSVKNYDISVSQNSLQLYHYKMDNDLLALYSSHKISFDEFYDYLSVSTVYHDMPALIHAPRLYNDPYVAGFRPNLNFLINDPSGFFKGAMGVKAWTGYHIMENLTAIGGVAYYPINQISTVNEKIPNAVRSDSIDYTGNKFIFDMALMSYLNRIPDTNVYTNLETGFLEMQYAGVNADAAVPFFNNNLLLGLSGSYVKKRSSDNQLEIKEDRTYNTKFIRARLHFRSIGSYVDLDYGRFLAGDVGTKVKFTKDINGVEISAWITKTDTSIFKDEYNRNYTDKGVMVTIPLRMFMGKDSRTTYAQKFSPWTRDVGAQVNEFTNLFDFIDRKYDKELAK